MRIYPISLGALSVSSYVSAARHQVYDLDSRLILLSLWQPIRILDEIGKCIAICLKSGAEIVEEIQPVTSHDVREKCTPSIHSMARLCHRVRDKAFLRYILRRA